MLELLTSPLELDACIFDQANCLNSSLCYAKHCWW